MARRGKQLEARLDGPAKHIPVLLPEVVGALVHGEGGAFIDGTLGLGSHARALLDAAGPESRLLGVDLDPECVALVRARLAPFGEKAVVRQGDFADLPALVRTVDWPLADGILLDLGLSTWLLESSGRGFSFEKDEPLDMRFDPTASRRAEDVVNLSSEEDLVRVLRDYGEERRAIHIARAIVRERERSRLETTADLRRVALGQRATGREEKTLARVFMAVRIIVNRELEKLNDALPCLVDLLRPGGRLAVIAYHSLEDRIVKTTFRRLSGECVCPPKLPVCGCHPQRKLRLIGGTIHPKAEEIRANPRSRSAVLRVVERTGEEDYGDHA